MKYTIEDTTLIGIADAIRAKTGNTDPIAVKDFAKTIEGIGGSDDLAKQLIERTITEISDDSIETIGSYAFANCKELTEVSFANCTATGDQAFYLCSKLVSADFPRLGKTANSLFGSCSALKSVNLPIVDNLRSNTFNGCSSIEKIDLPKVATINNQVFLNCRMLTALILRSKCSLTSTNSFNGTPIENGTGYIYAPADLIDSYFRTATNWSVFANQFRAIEDYPDICGG